MTDKNQPDQPSICHVALPIPGSDYYDYLTGGHHSDALQPGYRVEVPFGNGKRVGIISHLSSQTDVPQEKLKHINEVLDSEPLFSAGVLTLLFRAAAYYHHPLGEVLMTALPVPLRIGRAVDSAYQEYWQSNDAGKNAIQADLGRANKQWQLLQYLNQHQQGCSVSELARHQMNWRVLMQELAKKKLVKKIMHLPIPENRYNPEQPWPVLNEEQATAVDKIDAQGHQFSVNLLDGITGSGKTEVYLRLIQEQLSADKQVLILVPEIGLTPQLYLRIASRFNVSVAVLHSGLNDNERLNAWQAARLGESKVILGTRSAVFTPLLNPGLIIIDEEHDSSFKQIEGFRYNARDMAIMRAQIENTPVVLGSATPSLESVQNANAGHYQQLRLKQRAGDAVEPDYQLVDLRAQKLHGSLSGTLVAAMKETLAAGQQVMLYINRRGFAPAMLCHDCGAIFNCPRCSANTTFHAHKRTLRCHHCGFQQAAPKQCNSCNSTELITAGAGTEQIETLVNELFPDYKTVRIDRDSMSRKNKLQQTLHAVANNEYQIIIGTQLLAKGHDFHQLTLVGMIDVDQGLFSVDFRAPERMAQQITQVGGRSGRGKLRGKVIIQTHQPEHPLFTILLGEGIQAFNQVELSQRAEANFPPHGYLAMLRSSAKQQAQAEKFLHQVAELLAAHQQEILIAGPVPAPMEKKAERFRQQLLLQSTDRSVLHKLLKHYLPQIRALESGKRVRWSIDVDPIDLA